jgi:hypothetical protein
MEGFEKEWIGGRVAEGGAEPVDGTREAAIEVTVCVVGPELGFESVAVDDFTVTLDERDEQANWLVVQFEPQAMFAEFSGGAVQLEASEAELSRRLLHGHSTLEPESSIDSDVQEGRKRLRTE